MLNISACLFTEHIGGELTISVKILSCMRQIYSLQKNKPSGPTLSNMSQVNKVEVASDPELCPGKGLRNRFHRLSRASKYTLLLLLNNNSLWTHHLICDKIITLDHCATTILQKHFFSQKSPPKGVLKGAKSILVLLRKESSSSQCKNCQSQRKEQTCHIIILSEIVKIQLNFLLI